MPVESGQAQARRLVGERPAEHAAIPAAQEPPAGAAAPRLPHDEHELPDGRYLLAYRSAGDA